MLIEQKQISVTMINFSFWRLECGLWFNSDSCLRHSLQMLREDRFCSLIGAYLDIPLNMSHIWCMAHCGDV